MPKERNYSETVVNAFLKYDKVSDIIKETGLSRSTISRYRASIDFQQILIERKTSMVAAAVNRMQQSLTGAVDELEKIIHDKETPPQVRVNAINTLFSQCKGWTDTADIMARLTILEIEMQQKD